MKCGNENEFGVPGDGKSTQCCNIGRCWCTVNLATVAAAEIADHLRSVASLSVDSD